MVSYYSRYSDRRDLSDPRVLAAQEAAVVEALDPQVLRERRAQQVLARLALQDLAPLGQREPPERSEALALLVRLVQAELPGVTVGSVLRGLRVRPATLAALVTTVRQDPVVKLELLALSARKVSKA